MSGPSGPPIIDIADILITGIACGVAAATAINIANYLAGPRTVPCPGGEHGKDNNALVDPQSTTPKAKIDTNSTPPTPAGPATADSKQPSDSDSDSVSVPSADRQGRHDDFIPCSVVLAKYCTASSSVDNKVAPVGNNNDNDNNKAITDGNNNSNVKTNEDKDIVAKVEPTNNNNSTTSTTGSNEKMKLSSFADKIFSPHYKGSRDEGAPKRREECAPKRRRVTVPCEQLHFFYRQCNENVPMGSQCRVGFRNLIMQCSNQRATNVNLTVEVPDRDMLLIPFKQCMRYASDESKLQDCWENYGKYLKAFSSIA